MKWKSAISDRNNDYTLTKCSYQFLKSFEMYSTLRNISQEILQNISHAKFFAKCSQPFHNALTLMNDFHQSVQTNKKWQLIENKKMKKRKKCAEAPTKF